RIARLDFLALSHEHPRAARQLDRLRLLVLLQVEWDDRDLRTAVRVLDVNLAADLGHRGRALRVPRLEDLDDAREAVCDVRARHTTRVERAHRELRARLADRLCGDDADRVAD